jgi:protein TonB
MPLNPPYNPPATAAAEPSSAMFTNFSAGHSRKMPKWAAPLLAGVVAMHFIIFFSMWIKTIWEIEQLDRPKVSVDLAVAPPPPPPPPPPKGGAKPQTQVIEPKKIKVKDIVQPVKVEKNTPAPEEKGQVNGDEQGVEGGQEGGVVGGDLNGVMGAPPPPPPPPPPPAPPQIVPPKLLEGSRISGEAHIEPDDNTKTEITRSGKDKVIGTFKLCLSTDGNVASVSQIKSTSFSQYDAKILSTIRTQWRYRPYVVNGKAVPVCTAVTFIYSQK